MYVVLVKVRERRDFHSQFVEVETGGSFCVQFGKFVKVKRKSLDKAIFISKNLIYKYAYKNVDRCL